MISESRAWEIVDEFFRALSGQVGPSLQAGVVIGSLASGQFRPGISDIDTVVILSDAAPAEDVAHVQELQQQFHEKHRVPKGFGAVVLRPSELHPPYERICLHVADLMRIRRHGFVVWGAYDLQAIPEPGREDVLAYARTYYSRLRAALIDVTPIEPRGSLVPADCIFEELRLAVWQATGDFVSSKTGLVPAFARLPGTEDLAPKLRPLHEAVMAGKPLSDPAELEDLLQRVSGFVRQAVPLKPDRD